MLCSLDAVYLFFALHYLRKVLDMAAYAVLLYEAATLPAQDQGWLVVAHDKNRQVRKWQSTFSCEVSNIADSPVLYAPALVAPSSIHQHTRVDPFNIPRHTLGGLKDIDRPPEWRNLLPA